MAKSALIEELEKQFNENPRRVFARLANEYRKTGDLELAIDICRTHIPQQPSYISGYIVLGQALFETQQLDDAKSTFETALGLDPENLIALRQLGDIARVLGDTDTARAWYQRLLEVDPQNEEAAAQLQALPAPTPPSTPREAPSSELDEFGWREINPATAAVADEPAPEPAAALPEVESLTDWMTPASPATPAAQSDAVAEHEPVDLETTLEIPVVAPPDEPPSAEPVSTDLPMLDAELDAGLEEEPVAAAAAAPPALDLDDELVAGAEEPAPDESEPEARAEEPVGASFVTETMAELYERQGFRPEALRIYRQLAEQRPDDGALRRKIAELEGSGTGEESERVTIRQFFTRIARLSAPALAVDAADAADAAPDEAAAGESDWDDADATPVEAMEAIAESPLPSWMTPASAGAEPAPAAVPDEPEPTIAATVDTPTPAVAQDAIPDVATLFPDAPVAPADDDAARALSSAFADEDAIQSETVPGEPARPAPDELSLDDVFRELSGGKRESRPNGAVSFDEFFSNAGEGGESAGTENGAQPGEPKSGDLESFHAWLEGLKK